MTNIFRIDVLPAQHGDALWIEYGDRLHPRRVLIDGGVQRTARVHLLDRVKSLPDASTIELFVITHIDSDHIEGAIELLESCPETLNFERIWFNGRDHLIEAPLEKQGPAQGFALMDLLARRHPKAWNRDVGGKAIRVGADGEPVTFSLPGPMDVTLLSPDENKLRKLSKTWHELEALGVKEREPTSKPVEELPPGLERLGAKALDVAALAASAFKEDPAPANGSSIATLVEYGGKKVLFLADAHPSLVLASLKRLSPDGPLSVDCVKLAHHGSENNTHTALISHLSSPHWVFSSNGAMFSHPDQAAVARVLHGQRNTAKTLHFNYRTRFNEMWDDAKLQKKWNYKTVYGSEDQGVSLDLL